MFRKFLMGNYFLVRTDHRPLHGLFKKAITSLENEDLRDLVAGLTEYSFDVEYLPGESNCFPDWLSRNCVDELNSYPDFERVNLESFMRCSPETNGDDSFHLTSDVLC
jgi:hypothetical protein